MVEISPETYEKYADELKYSKVIDDDAKGNKYVVPATRDAADFYAIKTQLANLPEFQAYLNNPNAVFGGKTIMELLAIGSGLVTDPTMTANTALLYMGVLSGDSNFMTLVNGHLVVGADEQALRLRIDESLQGKHGKYE